MSRLPVRALLLGSFIVVTGASCGGTESGGEPDAGVPPGEVCSASGKSCAAGQICCAGLSCHAGVCGDPESQCPEVPGDRATNVCARWKCARQDLDEGTWTGNVAACNPGDNLKGRANALKNLNLQRYLAGLPEVTDSAELNASAQACALIMDANDQLDHTPPTGFACHTSEGAAAAGRSNLASVEGVKAVDLYMVDPGNASTLGHRRWILSNQLGPVGLGTTSSYSCLHVLGGSGTGQRAWTAWPPEGAFPAQAFSPLGFSSVNETGWSIQSNTINLTGAQVEVNDEGTALPVLVTPLSQNFGSTWAIRFNPQGWLPAAGHTYRVKVSGIPTPIDYEVEVVDCL